MITTYTTLRTAGNRNLRHLMLSTCDAGHNLRNHGMLLRVVNGNPHLLNAWLNNDSVNKPVVDDSPYAPATGIATLAFDGSQGIGERSRSWSHSHRRSRGRIT